MIGKFETASKRADDRHYDVTDERVDDLSEGRDNLRLGLPLSMGLGNDQSSPWGPGTSFSSLNCTNRQQASRSSGELR
jgi:hypothetical protein